MFGRLSTLVVLGTLIATPGDVVPGEDEPAAVLQEATKDSESGSRPEVRLAREPGSGTPLVIMSGSGLAGQWMLSLRCAEGAWTLFRTSFEGDTEDATATFRVPSEAANAVLQQPRCQIAVLDRVVAVRAEAAATAWGLPASPGGRDEVVGQVLWVLDGQTIGVQIGKRVETVRYTGVTVHETAPGRSTAPGELSGTAVNRLLVANRAIRVELDQQARDPVGRVLAYVYVGETMINAELVRRGYAEATAAGPNLRHRAALAKLEDEARREGRGLWAQAETPETGRTAQPTDTEGLACPSSHPIKAHTLPGGRKRFYPESSRWGRHAPAEACYASELEAMIDGYKRYPR